MLSKNFSAYLVAAVTIVMVAAYLVYPYAVDDWGYMSTFRSAAGIGDGAWPLDRAWRWMPFHWLHVNGRTANFLAGLFLGFLPKWLVSTLCGVAVGAMLALVLRLGGVWRRVGRQSVACAVVAVIMVVFPWWDWMFSVDLNFNYVLATAIALGFMWTLQTSVRFPLWLLCLWGIMAGAVHEACGMPLAAGIIWSLLVNRTGWKDLGRPLRTPLLFFMAGALIAITSPGIWGRFFSGGYTPPDGTPAEILLVSAPLTLIVFAVFIVMLLFPGGRRHIFRLMKGVGGCFAVASAGSLFFCAMGGTMGRSGGFSQAFALIAFLQLAGDIRVSIGRRWGMVLSSLSAVLAIAVCVAPLPGLYRAGRAFDRLVSELASSPDGVVYLELPDEHSQPWYTLGRLRSIEPADDYYLHEIARFYGRERLVVLPPEASEVDFDALSEPLRLPDGSVVTPRQEPSYAPEAWISNEGDGGSWMAPDGTRWMCVPFPAHSGRMMYHLFPCPLFFSERGGL